MKTILMTAYAVNPQKGSEDGMGWNYVLQAARHNYVTAVTRVNNRDAIEAYMKRNDVAYKVYFDRITFLYFDWPAWMLFWKKGPLLSMIYYYLWQYSVALWLKKMHLNVDIVHNLNFHNDWTPSFLWMLRKPFVWGPVGHHPKIPFAFIRQSGLQAYLKDRMLWALKSMFWRLDPFLALTRKKADLVWCMHPESVQKLKLQQKYFLHPSVAAEAVYRYDLRQQDQDMFTVLSVGRFVALKGFDICIRSFARFYRMLPESVQSRTRLVLVGKGEERQRLLEIAREEGVETVLDLRGWMSPQELTAVYQQASAFLYPSYEGAGMVVPEAMRYRIPVLCWDNQGPGFIIHPESKLKVPYTTYDSAVQSFSELLYRLWADPAFYEQEAGMAYDRFYHHLDWDCKADQLQHLYTAIS